MKDYRPYQNWTRQQMFENVEKTCLATGNSDLIEHYRQICFDIRWNPCEDYNGCNVIQDRLHIFPPCLEHDRDWFVFGGGVQFDRKFRKRCMQFGSTPCEAKRNYLGVRIGWLFYFKWAKMIKKLRK